MNEYDLNKQQWSRTQSKLLDGEGQRNVYWQICMDRRDNIYVSWVWRESRYVESNHDVCYAVSKNSGFDWFDSTGSAYTMPITISNAEIAWNIPQNSELINQTSMTTDKSGNPFIATYWRSENSKKPQYRIIYNDGYNWHQSQVGNRTTPFSLSGARTKRIPVARPRMVVDDKGKAMYLFRDVERNEVVSMYYCKDIKNSEWEVMDLTDFPVEAWEPTIDVDRWKRDGVLDIYVLKSYQEDGEVMVENAEAEMAYVLEIAWR